MYDNYPPGVTGNEREIAGDDEMVLDAECDGVIDGVDGFEDTICTFKGKVDATGWNGEFTWECPECDAEHNFTVEDDREPDDRDDEEPPNYDGDFDYRD